MQGDKLFIRGKASSEDAKNKVKGWELISRKGNFYKSFRPLSAGFANALACDAILDGEIVHLDVDGKPQF